MTTVEAGENQKRNLPTNEEGVLTMKRKQKQNAEISKPAEEEPCLSAQLTTKSLTLHGRGKPAIHAVSLIVCLAIIAIAVIAVVVLLTKPYQTGSQENAQQTVHSSQPFSEKILEDGNKCFFNDKSIDWQVGST